MKMSFFDTLDAVLRSGSLAGAAREMNVTPSAVSMQMKQLEVHFGQPLFDRAGLRVRPTPLALEIVGVLRAPMQRVEALRSRPSTQVEGRVRLGVIETMQSSLLPAAAMYLRERYPALDVRPVRGRTVELIEAVKAGRMDAAVVVQPSTGGSQRLVWHPVFRNELVLVAPPHVAEARVSALFKSHDWIRFDPSTSGGRLAMRWVTKHVRETRATMDLQSVQAVVAMVSAGLGVSVLQRPDARMVLAYPVRILPLGRGAPALQISLVSRTTDADSRQLSALREAIESVTGAGTAAARR
jgi:DNA-binding transcriptional LysR family regulator